MAGIIWLYWLIEHSDTGYLTDSYAGKVDRSIPPEKVLYVDDISDPAAPTPTTKEAFMNAWKVNHPGLDYPWDRDLTPAPAAPLPAAPTQYLLSVEVVGYGEVKYTPEGQVDDDGGRWYNEGTWVVLEATASIAGCVSWISSQYTQKLVDGVPAASCMFWMGQAVDVLVEFLDEVDEPSPAPTPVPQPLPTPPTIPVPGPQPTPAPVVPPPVKASAYTERHRLIVGVEPSPAAKALMARVQSMADSEKNREGGLLAALKRAWSFWTSDTKVQELALEWGLSEAQVKAMINKIVATGLSGTIFAATGNFPVAAMGYFAADRALATGGTTFNGVNAPHNLLDGHPLVPYEVELPNGLPNEIFGDYQFTCYDRLTGRWWPSDEVRPLSYDSNEPYRWLVLDRISGKILHCEKIKAPRIYMGA